MNSRIPDRWTKYTALGKRIANTPFVAFKCPLNKALSISLPPEAKFGLEDIRTAFPRVSLIIDLTNTKRYYNPKVLKDLGIEHKKIFTPGHVIPPKSKFHQFFHIVDNFIKNNEPNSNKLIGVHCTHGVNRTGLFICSYMISKLGYNYASAVEQFNLARGHSIERENYLNELKRYETKPLNFDSVSYLMSESEKQQKYWIKPLMGVPPPLIPPHLMPLPARVSRKKDRIQRIQPLMHLPPPLLEPSYPFVRDHRPFSSYSERPPPGRNPFVAPRRSEFRGMKPLYRNQNRHRT